MKRAAIREFMTPLPHTIGRDQPMSAAHRLMNEHRIRHLPVLAGGELVGIVSDRDLKFVEALKDVDPERVTIEEAMSQAPYTVAPETPLGEVVSKMADERYGAALVVERGSVVGIFTAIDALRTLSDMLSRT
jgi:acetoin utilization protein AcuB